jgi:hypothetical protein
MKSDDEIQLMRKVTRRDFLVSSAAVSAGFALGSKSNALASPRRDPISVPLTWLGNKPPKADAAVAWGVPWPKGTVSRDARIGLRDRNGNAVPAQIWPMAYWPDGSLKWSGMTIAAAAGAAELTAVFDTQLPPAPAQPVRVDERADCFIISNGPLVARIDKQGQNLITSILCDGREIARDGRLIAAREDRSRYEAEGILREERYFSQIGRVTIEQAGPVRAVVHIEGKHASTGSGAWQWLPFSVRVYFTAGLHQVRMVHSFVFDGNQATDFIKGLGLSFSIPFREEAQNRHIRFATDAGYLFSEPVLMAPGYRPSAMAEAAQLERDQINGKPIQNLAAMTPRDRANLQKTAVWDSFKLTQLSANGWNLFKRTNRNSSWLHITSGNRAQGLAYLGDVSGGMAIGVKRFWQKYPSAFEITGASTDAGELRVWLWSPEAQAMDLRHYDTVGHSLDVTYEDYEPARATAFGCANTSELTLWCTPDTPSPEQLAAMTETSHTPPLLVCAPEHYYNSHSLGFWSLPGKPVPGLSSQDLTSVETQLDRAFRFYSEEVERRKWYGFWDYGDFRRTYDPIRHQWMYDIGGHGWNATELMPNVWLWFAFLRSGRADIFQVAEDMTRNTNEVDVYHLGPLAGLGSRHNVSHWADSKEARINEAFIKRFYYYLTTDERTGDLMREPLLALEKSLAYMPPLHEVVPRPEIAAPQSFIRVGPDWLALASNWLAEWERTGDTKYRDYCLTGMNDIGAMANVFLVRDAFAFDPATKHLKDVGEPNQRPSQFLFLFAGDQIVAELISLIHCPSFAKAWDGLCEQFASGKRSNWYFETRVTAYAANTSGRADLETRSLDLYKSLLRFRGTDYFVAAPDKYEGPSVPQLAIENKGTSTFTPAIATPEVSQWAINLITVPELFRNFGKQKDALGN